MTRESGLDPRHDELLIGHALDELNDDDRREAESILARSATARRRHAEYRELVDVTRDIPPEPAPAGVLVALLAAQRASPASRAQRALAWLNPHRLAPVAVAATMALTLLGSGIESVPAESLAADAFAHPDALVGRPTPTLRVTTTLQSGTTLDAGSGWQSERSDSGSTGDSL